ncbi:cysteine-rich RLK (RECEPTOR-like protein kinase) 8 [Abeliophyllum distichum]|uniref:Cysteine-rich RLK (RECEPTOR-like protein kinase) 8 n=1 Tax=Abeliophyllum distichum TaxID=126358 RepID=A0ABD1TY90_9LAMI
MWGANDGTKELGPSGKATVGSVFIIKKLGVEHLSVEDYEPGEEPHGDNGHTVVSELVAEETHLKSLTEAILNPLWQQAITDDFSAIDKTDTWNLVSLPQGEHAIGSRWVYKIKTKSDGSIELYKARLAAKGFTQQYVLDYEETFAHVAKMTTVRTLIAVASIFQWDVSQLDVKNLFLNGTSWIFIFLYWLM